jgi:hypothetical protein
MKRYKISLSLALLIAMVQETRAEWLWQIGKDDGQYKEFATADQGPRHFGVDPMFLVGTSDASRDWPFVHPGPGDAWAGGRTHTFSIVFGLSDVQTSGKCTLSVALVDTHHSAPPRLTFILNGTKFEKQMPQGAGDASVNGHPELGKPYRFEISFPSDLLKRGANLIEIVNDKGSWVLYDWVGLQAPEGTRLQKLDGFTVATATAVRGLVERDGRDWQPVRMDFHHAGPEVTAQIRVGSESAQKVLASASDELEVLVPAVTSPQKIPVHVDASGQTFDDTVSLEPVRKMTIYVLPHSHNDVGYTDIQTNVEKKQMANLEKGIAIARKTAGYPPGARFVWNMEVLWGADLYLHRMSESKREEFVDAVKRGQVSLNGMYANELTGLCRPEELIQLFRYATQLSQQTGVKIDSAMLSDVPGMTWGASTAMAEAGIRYFSLAPNYFDRIGSIQMQWQDKPFWWVAPDGRQKVLVWMPWTGYAMSHIVHRLSDKWVSDFQDRMDKIDFPFDISYIRWAGRGDNAEPDPDICEFIKSWNTRFAWPKLVIASTSEAFAAFEKRYGDKLPSFKGDITPYWEDGAASSSLETAMNRNSADRLVQAEALFALRGRPAFPADAFDAAWKNVLLYSEHTWGAYCSVSDSENPLTKAQWKIKQAFALDANRQSRELIREAVAPPTVEVHAGMVDVFNTTSWPRTQLVTVTKELSNGTDRVTDSTGRPVPSQRLSDGDLAVLVTEVPPFAAIRLKMEKGTASDTNTPVKADKETLGNRVISCRIDPNTGGISELGMRGIEGNFSAEPLNSYVYLPGSNLSDLEGSGPAKVSVVDNGPLVATLRIDSDAAGCNHLTREVRLVAGTDHVDLTNIVDKKRVPPNPHPGRGGQAGEFAQRGSKESVSFAFAFNVEQGQVRLDVPFAVMRPEADQLPGACKNWLPVGRYMDVSNDAKGVTLATLDAPLVELGRLSTLLGSQSNPDVWRKEIEPTQKIYSWVMNNHWGTNYRAYQDGLVTFRYALRPHAAYDPAEASRFATALSQPLVVAPATGPAPPQTPFLRVEPPDVLVTTLKPADDSKGLIVRLFGASGHERTARLSWASPAPPKMWLSDTSEKAISPVGNEVTVPGSGLVTIRAQLP